MSVICLWPTYCLILSQATDEGREGRDFNNRQNFYFISYPVNSQAQAEDVFCLLSQRLRSQAKEKKSLNTICERIDLGRTFATETCRRIFSFIASSQAFVNRTSRKNKDWQHLHRITPKQQNCFSQFSLE